MARMRVFVLLLLVLNGVFCDVNQEKDTKRTTKSSEWKKVEKKSTNTKRDSSGAIAIFGVKQNDEPFRPLYQYHYPGAPLRPTSTRYVSAATTQQLTYSKPDAVIGIGGSPSSGRGGSGSDVSSTETNTIGGIQYAAASPYKHEGGIQYAPSAYKSGGGIQYASSAYRGPFIATYQPQSVGPVKVHSGPIYAQPPPAQPHTHAAVTLPLHYGGYEQQLQPQHHQQNQYAIAFPSDYLRHYQQNLPAPFPLHGAHIVPLVYSPSPASTPSQLQVVKDQQFKPNAVQFISLAPQAAGAGTSPAASGPAVITHYLPYYGSGGQHPQQFQQHSVPQFVYGGHHQQAPTTFAYGIPQQQQTFQITPKQQIFQMAAVGAAAAATVIPFKPIVITQQQQQQLQQPHQQQNHHHPDATSYVRYVHSAPGASGSSGGSNHIEVPASETSSSSAHKLSPLYSSSSSTSSGNIYAAITGGGSDKMSYIYAPDANSVGTMFSHPGAVQYGSHLYHPPTKVVEIGSNRVTAGSAAVAGVAPPAYHPKRQSGAGNSHGGVVSSRPVAKFS